MKYDWILFDADNTLFDFTRSSRLAFEGTLENAGITFKDEYYHTYKKVNDIVWRELEEGKINPVELRVKRFRMFFEATGLEGDPAQTNHHYLMQLVEQTVLIDGAEQLLQSMQGHCRMAIITNGLKEVQRPRITHARLDHYFEAIVVSDEIGHAKPERAFFEYTFKAISQPNPERVMVVGDNLHSDIKGGNDFGLPTCWYNPNRLNNESDITPQFEITALQDLPSVVGL